MRQRTYLVIESDRLVLSRKVSEAECLIAREQPVTFNSRRRKDSGM